jgi:hypothetical protein
MLPLDGDVGGAGSHQDFKKVDSFLNTAGTFANTFGFPGRPAELAHAVGSTTRRPGSTCSGSTMIENTTAGAAQWGSTGRR